MKLSEKLKSMRPGELIILAGVVLLVVLRFDQAAAMAELLLRSVMPLIVGAIMAYIINLIVRPIERIYFPNTQRGWIAKTRKPAAVLLAMLAILLVLALVLWLVIPQLYATVKELTARLPADYERLKAFVSQYFRSIPELQQLPDFPSNLGQQVPRLLTGFAGGLLSAAGDVAGAIFEFIVSLIFAIYLLISRDTLRRQFNRLIGTYLPDRKRQALYTVSRVADDSFASFFTGQAIEAVILGGLCTVGMLILGFPYAFMIGTVIGITALIPLIGAYIGGAVGFLLIASDDINKALWFLVFLVILQQLEGDIIFPRVVGSSVGLPGIWVFVAVVIGGSLFGIPGILFGVPIAATAYKLLRRDMRSRSVLEGADPAAVRSSGVKSDKE